MLVRIKFVIGSTANRMKKNELEKLANFFGEEINAVPLKIEDEKLYTLRWDETFDKKEVEERDSKKLAIKSDYVQIEDSQFFLADLNEFLKQYPSLEVSIKGIPKSLSTDNNSLFDRLSEMQEKIETVANRFNEKVEFNQKCDVHVPGLGLMNINRLGFATDKCTEELQLILNRGWRILAVCPQPDQRRPDYILGKSVDAERESLEVEQF